MEKMSEKVNMIDLKDYQYFLPEERIAAYPLANRSDSRLLFYRSGTILHYDFSDIAGLLPEDSLLVFNNTKVIPARMFFNKSTGSAIEVFLLNPEPSHLPVNESMTSFPPVIWTCMIGNKKRWKLGEKLFTKIKVHDEEMTLVVEWADRKRDKIKFEWTNKNIAFSEVIAAHGNVPLPPYIKRKPVPDDLIRYQTIFSKREGAVAAPTAGLHFTDRILEQIRERGLDIDYLTLHVSAGTFQPIKHSDVLDHPMHKEQILITRENLDHYCTAKKIIAVGTTALRSLESLYWLGVKLLLERDSTFMIGKLFPYKYETRELPTRIEAFEAVRNIMNDNDMHELVGETEIFIFPGYQFKVCEGLITNFHLPASTLILLVAAFVGENWASIYEQALQNNYRFLSYGDSSLLLR